MVPPTFNYHVTDKPAPEKLPEVLGQYLADMQKRGLSGGKN